MALNAVRAGVLGWILLLLLTPAPGRADGYLLANTSALNNLAAPYGRQIVSSESCSLGAPSTTTCAGSALSSVAGPSWLGTTVNFGAARSDLARGQIKAFTAGGGGFFEGSGATGQLGDVVAIGLAPGASWPQSFLVRVLVDGRFSNPITGGSGSGIYYRAFFRSNAFPEPGLDVGLVFMDESMTFPIVHEKQVTLSGPTVFFVDGVLGLNSSAEAPITMDFSSSTSSGLRFEVDLPADLVMTSESGVFLTAAVQPACTNGTDDDFDGIIDVAAGEPGCIDPDDESERGDSICDNGLDDDADGLVDYPSDIGCNGPNGPTEAPEPGRAALLATGLLWLARLGSARGRRGAKRSARGPG